MVLSRIAGWYHVFSQGQIGLMLASRRHKYRIGKALMRHCQSCFESDWPLTCRMNRKSNLLYEEQTQKELNLFGPTEAVVVG